MTESIARVFPDTEVGNLRRYWFVGGISAGFMAVGTVKYWGIRFPDIAILIAGWALFEALIIAKRRGDWNV